MEENKNEKNNENKTPNFKAVPNPANTKNKTKALCINILQF